MPSRSSTSGGFHIAISRSACGRPVAVDQQEVESGEPLRQLDRVGDRGAGEHEARLAAVGPGQPPQPPQHVGHVGAEHAAVGVRLVHHHPGQVGQEIAPGTVIGQDAHVQHVGVGEDEVGARADRAPFLARRVAVVDGVTQEAAAERGQLAGLVLGQRLRRIEVERPGGRIPGERVQHRQVERQRLAAGRARRHDRVPPRRCLQGVGLVGPELVDSCGRQRPPREPGEGRPGSGAETPRAACSPTILTSVLVRGFEHRLPGVGRAHTSHGLG